MKRAAACLLAFCLAIQGSFSAVSAYGSDLSGKQEARLKIASSNDADILDREEKVDESDQSGSKDSGLAEKKAEGRAAEDKQFAGAVKVEITDLLHLGSGMSLDIQLRSEENDGEGAYDGNDHISLEPDVSNSDGTGGTWSKTVVFEKLPPGDYTLTVKSERYETYCQEIEVGDKTYSVTLMNDYLTDTYSYEKGKMHPGVLKLGDINDDGTLDEVDMARLINALAEPNKEQRDSNCDLNGDGSVDLIDLQYFTIFYNNKLDAQAAVVTTASVRAEDVTATMSNAQFDGEVASLFTNTNDKAGIAVTADQNIHDNPVTLTVSLDSAPVAGALTIAPITGSEKKITAGSVEIEDKRGNEKKFSFGTPEGQTRAMYRSAQEAAPAGIDADGTIIIDLGGQTAVKKLTLHITDTSEPNKKQVEISKVEFLNSIEDRIASPVMNIPEKVTIAPGSASFQVSWKKTANVSGYEVKVEEKEAEPGKRIQSQIFKTTSNQLDVTGLNNENLVANKTYLVSVRSVNGDWRSGYSEPVEAMPKPLS